MPLPPVAELAVFLALLLVLALYGLTVSGHFPAQARVPALRSAAGRAVLWSTIAVAVGLAGCAAAIAWLRLPLYAVVIGGGMVILFAPLMLQPLPDSFVDGRAGLVTFAAIGSALALTAWKIMT